MVLTIPPALEQISLPLPENPDARFAGVPVVDLSQPGSEALLVRACEELGFFKVINHGVPRELIANLEAMAEEFFALPQEEKERGGPASPFGYGSKNIGCSGDVGWVEYLLFAVAPKPAFGASLAFLSEPSASSFSSALKEYAAAVRRLTRDILELMAKGLKMEQRDVLSRLVTDEESDCLLRINHYPRCPLFQDLINGGMTGFGEHTDPQIVSLLRSNNSSGLQIARRDGSWFSVPPDADSFFVNVGDSLQVLTNGRFRSVKHRVLVNSSKPRVSMVYFGGPPSGERLAPLPLLMGEGEQKLYREFTWCEYKRSAYRTRLADNRLGQFEM